MRKSLRSPVHGSPRATAEIWRLVLDIVRADNLDHLLSGAPDTPRMTA